MCFDVSVFIPLMVCFIYLCYNVNSDEIINCVIYTIFMVVCCLYAVRNSLGNSTSYSVFHKSRSTRKIPRLYGPLSVVSFTDQPHGTWC